MNAEVKKKIDDVWLKSDFGSWCIAVADDNVNEAGAIAERIFNAGYLTMEMLEDKLATEIVELIKSEEEIDEYLKMLEKENSSLVGVIIQQELFFKVSEQLKNKL